MLLALALTPKKRYQMTGVNKNISLVLGAQRGDAEREAGSELVRARQSPAQARLFVRASFCTSPWYEESDTQQLLL